MLDTHTDNGHSLISPSAATRWANCPASVRLTIGIEGTTSSAAQYGTDVHYLGELMLQDPSREFIINSSVMREDGKSYFIANKTMIDEARSYMEYVHGLCDPELDEIIPEAHVSILPEYDLMGHIDATVITDDALHIVDLKTGRGAVSATENLQMQLYAIGVINEYEEMYDFDKVVLHIVQDNDKIHNTNSWETTVDDLMDFKEWISERARLALQEDSECNPSEKACQWCNYADKCKALHDKAVDLLSEGVDNFEERETIDNIDVDEVSMDAVVKLLNNEKLITDLIKKYQERVLNEMLAGNEVDGFKLIRSRKNKRWVNEIDAFDKIKKWLPIDDVAPRKLATPTQVAKMLGKDVSSRKKNIFEGLFEVPEGDLKAVPLSARGEAISLSDVVDVFDDDL